VNEALIVEISYRMAQLTKNEDSLYGTKRPFAEALPILDMIWSFKVEKD
jgi:hypothetical protein